MSTRESTSFGVLLLRHRAAAHLTQEQLAAQAGLSVDAVAALERGKRRTPRGATVALLAAALGLDDATRAEFLAAARSSRVAIAMTMATAADAENVVTQTRQPSRLRL